MAEPDGIGKWLIAYHPDSLLRVAGIADVAECMALANEVVVAHRLPDGLLQYRRHGQAASHYALVELEAYPARRVARQTLRKAAMVFADRDELPEVFVFVLQPKGQLAVPPGVDLASELGTTRWSMTWRVVE